MCIRQRLGAAKQKKRARRGRTGQDRGACADEDGNAAFRFRNAHGLDHGPIAVPPADASDKAKQRKCRLIFLVVGGFLRRFWGVAQVRQGTGQRKTFRSKALQVSMVNIKPLWSANSKPNPARPRLVPARHSALNRLAIFASLARGKVVVCRRVPFADRIRQRQSFALRGWI
jgi:hypothetical protein